MNIFQRAERMIVRRVIRDAIAAGYSLSVNNGDDSGELAICCSQVPKHILHVMFATDDEWLILNKGGKQVGWVRLIYGNDGWDVMNDYSTNIEDVLKGALALSESLAP